MEAPASVFAGMGLFRSAARLIRLLLGVDGNRLPVEPLVGSVSGFWLALASLGASVGLGFIALAQIAGMHGFDDASVAYWLGLFAIVSPVAFRVAYPAVSRSERLALILIVGLAFYILKIIHSPVGFTAFDEFQHWATAGNIMRDHHLFSENPLLPISALYPGLEIVTTALANLSGLSVFASGVIVIGLARTFFLITLFLIVEILTASPRVAAIACILFMSNANFSMFHAQFAYESFAVVLMALMLLAALRLTDGASSSRTQLAIAATFGGAVALSHHLTSYFGAMILVVLAVLSLLEGGFKRRGLSLALLAVIVVGCDAVWWKFTDQAGSGYLVPALKKGISEFLDFLMSPGNARVPFTSDDGVAQPLWQRLTAIANYLLICIGLATGFIRSLRLAGGRIERSGLRFKFEWKNSALVLFTFLTLGFPLSVLLRFTQAGWELGSRLGSFVTFGVCVVVAISIACMWQGLSANRVRSTILACLLAIALISGNILGWGPNNQINYPFKVGADSRSVGAQGISAANWTDRWLGPGQRFVTDRINRNLLTVYGNQVPVTSLWDGINSPNIITAKAFANEQLNAIRLGRADYVMIDLRLTTSLPVLGVYFEGGEDSEVHASPLETGSLLKFNKIVGVGRPLDSGAIIIYDVRALHGAS